MSLKWHPGMRLIEEGTQSRRTVPAIARLHGTSATPIFKWGRSIPECHPVAGGANKDVVAVGLTRELEQQVRELERLLGHKNLEAAARKGRAAERTGRDRRHGEESSLCADRRGKGALAQFRCCCVVFWRGVHDRSVPWRPGLALRR